MNLSTVTSKVVCRFNRVSEKGLRSTNDSSHPEKSRCGSRALSKSTVTPIVELDVLSTSSNASASSSKSDPISVVHAAGVMVLQKPGTELGNAAIAGSCLARFRLSHFVIHDMALDCCPVHLGSRQVPSTQNSSASET